MRTAKTKTKCFVKSCKNTTICARGLCPTCYLNGQYLVRTKKATWEQLEKMGLAKPKKTTKLRALFIEFEKLSKKTSEGS